MNWFLVAALLGSVGLAVWLWLQLQRSKVATELAETEMKKLQGSQAQVMHTTKLASLGQMVAGVTHEINTPLGFVRSNAQVVVELLAEHRNRVSKVSEVLTKMCAAEVGASQVQDALRRGLPKIRAMLDHDERLNEASELLTDALEGVDQISSLVKNLKGFARVDRDGQDLWNVNEGIESALIIAQHQLRDRIEVVKNLESVPLVRVIPSQINQVFLNLITNAAQAMGERGRLTVESRRNGSAVEVEFTDTGHGITAEILPKIFDPFFTTKPVGEGTGLGLSIVHKIVTSHGGNITVASTPGQGARFIVSLPVDHAALKSHGLGASAVSAS